ncbi:glycosyl hydrolase [Caulobacter rhizosphaerae]|uniref:glycosyl hydrolase n=1 Tax=Caulobacter rhizosphaerae TaxID=2010972 RepID=UPI0013D42562|nr:glycosyl hydrolase [Caulobacter rhizosphaerae]GGL36304.1 hypothetical protein GCM10010983_36730 [Caulobacter rhizosphaerae]
MAQTVAASTPGGLAQSFVDPPPAARPRVWWHWMDGNVSQDGIVKDLAWMARVGIGGVQNFDGSLHTPQVVSERAPYGGEAWRAALRRAVAEAQARGLEFTIASSPGWSETGGPWVRPEQAMKKLVWSELDLEGGKPFAGVLPSPPHVSGPFQDLPGGGAEPSAPPPPGLPSLYRDAKVIAYRVPAGDRTPDARITTSAPFDAAELTRGDRTRFQPLAMGADGQGWIDFAYPAPVTMRAVELVLEPGPRIGPIYPSWPTGRIEASDDGRAYRKIADLPARGAPQQTIAFAATTARHFRVLLTDRYAPFPVKAFAPPDTPVAAHGVAHVRVLGEARVSRFEDKAGWSTVSGLAAAPTPAADTVIAAGDVIDLSDRLGPDGTLRWTPPAGRWRVLRLGWSLTGKLNNPASEEGTGLEVDKLNREHVKAYVDHYLGLYEKAVGRDNMGARGIGYMLNDSYEAMAANWTDDILVQFKARRGYDPTPWLPVLTGRVVTNAEDSDRFLWDFRRTLSDLIDEAHYGQLSDELHARGMGRYGEAHEALRAFVGDGMEVKKSADVPMGATWAMPSPSKFLPDILESASVAHLYGQNLVAAESFTAIFPSYGFDPASLKPIADKMLANGVNRFVIHTSVHQPVDTPGPGIGLGGVGQWFTRKETWAELARPWTDYLARSSQLLQQGRFVADIAWFYGEDDNITALYDERPPAVPEGYGFDFVNADAIRSILSAQDGQLVAPGGGRYRVLAIDPVARITLPTLRKLDALSRQGVVIAGPRPGRSPSLADEDREFAALAQAVWGRTGRTFSTIDAALSALDLRPDANLGNPSLSYVHRKLDDADLYFVANLGDAPVETRASFRVGGGAPEIWRADDGSRTPASYDRTHDRTEVPLVLGAHDALFVVFGKSAAAASYRAPAVTLATLKTVSGPWRLGFPAASGAPAAVPLPALASWTDSKDPGVRYFSGAARYAKSVTLPAKPKDARLFLDLGQVANVARVTVNGRAVGYAWKAPYRVDITDAARTGRNRLEIEVANLWPNRLIGDRQPGAGPPRAQAAFDPFKPDTPLLPSGLMGPVRLLVEAPVGQAGRVEP